MGVLNDYTNSAAVNAALNKGVEANKAVSELKEDLVEFDSRLSESLTEVFKEISDGCSLVNLALDVGAISTSTGEDVSNSTTIRSKYIKVDDGFTYIVYHPTSFTAYLFEYDDAKQFVKYRNLENYHVIDNTTPYIRILFQTNNVLDSKLIRMDFAERVFSQNGYGLISENYTEFTTGYIETGKTIGELVPLNVISNSSFVYSVKDCFLGQKFIVTGFGGTKPRLWAFIDTNGKLCSVSNADSYQEDFALIAPCDGKIIVNSHTNYRYGLIAGEPINVGEKISGAVNVLKNEIFANEISDDFEKPSGSNYVKNYRFDIVKGHTYSFNNTSVSHTGTAMNASTRIEENGANIETIASGWYEVNGVKYFTATSNANYLRIVANNNGSFIFKDESTIVAQFDKKLEKKLPIVKFDIKQDLIDVSSINSLMDWSKTWQQDDVLEQVYSLYDALMAEYPNFVSKVDIATELGLTYPSYANGYDGVPLYKTYMYKISYNNTNIGNHRKKFMLVSGVHGNEIASVFNSYIFARRMCKDFMTDENLFKLRSAFDIYIIPCLNGYGMYKITRGNANKVNINRNFPVYGWEVYGEDSKDNSTGNEYTGAYAGSEFETQIVMGAINIYKPDLFIDHHNYSVLDFAFYSDVCKEEFLPLTYQSMVDCSMAFKKGLPKWFGNNFDLLVHRTGASPSQTENPIYGTTVNWATQNGVPFSATVEISECINYINGVYDGTKRNDDFGNDTFSVGEYTLRSQILRYAQWVLENT